MEDTNISFRGWSNMSEIPQINIFDKTQIIAKQEEKLNPFAQRNEFANRHTPDDNRTEFQRDKDRILHSKYFRRLMHKTQIFSDTDEYYRTRLTHTLEVMQIARSIARVLIVNEDLTEAISFGHDLGHTPFGHVGERILNDILTGTENLKGKIKASCGGFNHNFQAVRLIDNLPTYYKEPNGLNLTWQVREGILKHTKIREKSARISDGKNDKALLCIYPNFKSEGLYLDYDFSVTIEGQIVAQADEIAQRAHDLDDGLRSKYIQIQDLEMNPAFIEIFEGDFTKLHEIKKAYVENDYLLRQECVRQVIRYFVKNLVNCSKENISEYWNDSKNVELLSNEHIVTKELVRLNEPYKSWMDTLEKHITSRVINSHEVNVCDGKALYLIKHVFKAFLANPRQLPVKTLKEINLRLKHAGLNYVDLTTAKKDEVKECILIWQGIKPENKPQISDYEVTLQHQIFVRAIADYIGGLTDNQLNETYKKLYLP